MSNEHRGYNNCREFDALLMHPSSNLQWKPHLLQVLDTSRCETRGSFDTSPRSYLPYFEEWLALRRVLGSSSKARPTLCRTKCSSLPKLSSNSHKTTLDARNPQITPSNGESPLSSELRSNSNMSQSSTIFKNSESSGDSERDSFRYCHGSNIQKEASSFCLESSKRIRDSILSSAKCVNKTSKSSCNQQHCSVEDCTLVCSKGLFSYGNSPLTISLCDTSRENAEDQQGKVVTSEMYLLDNLSSVRSQSNPESDLYQSMHDLDRSTPKWTDAGTQTVGTGPHMDSGLYLVSYASGAQYAGEICEGKPHGEGRFASGECSYQGGWRGGKPHGRGDYCWPDGDRYCGEFVDGRREGHGIYYTWSGEKYAGLWRGDELSGLGICTQGDGQRLVLTSASRYRGLTPHPSTEFWISQDVVVGIELLPVSAAELHLLKLGRY